MARRITITLPDDQYARVRAAVERRKADSMAEWIRHAVKISIQDEDAWKATLAHGLELTGGPLTPEEAAWADAVLNCTSKEGLPPEPA